MLTSYEKLSGTACGIKSLILTNGSGWPSGLRRCVQVAVYPCRRGSNPTPDKIVLFQKDSKSVRSQYLNKVLIFLSLLSLIIYSHL